MKIPFAQAKIDALKAPLKGRKIYWDTRTPKLCVRVTEKGTKSFYYVTKHNGKTEWVRLGRFPDMTPSTARARAVREASRFGIGDNSAEEKRQAKSEWTVKEAWKLYRAKNEHSGGKSLGPIDGDWRNHFSQWANKRLSEVTSSMAECLQDNLKIDRSNGTVNRTIATGRAFFNFAIKRKGSGFDGPNPFDGLDKLPETPRKARLRTSQMPEFFQALETVTPLMRDFILVGLWTGRRAGDLKTMRWTDLDLDAGTWLIPNPKSGEPQEVGLSRPAIEILMRRKMEGSENWVFVSNSKSGHIEEYKKAWLRVTNEAGLNGLRFHDLRRSISSIAQEHNISHAVAGAQLGHKDPATTMKYYTNIDLHVQIDAMNVVAKVILAAAKNESARHDVYQLETSVNDADSTLKGLMTRIESFARMYADNPDDPWTFLTAILGLISTCHAISPSAGDINSAFATVMARYDTADVHTLDEAFGLQRPKNWNQGAEKRRLQQGYKIELRVNEAREQLSIDEAFEAVAKEFHLSSSTVKQDYYNHKKRMERFRSHE